MINRKYSIWVLMLLLISSVFYLASINWNFVKFMLKDSPYFKDESKMIDPSKEIQHIKIGDYIADIPINYFWRNYVFNGSWWHVSAERLEGNLINIEVTWPDLKPWTPENDKLFKEPGSPRTISVSLSKMRNADWPFHYFKNFRKNLKLQQGVSEVPGLLHFIDSMGQDIYLEYDEPRRGMVQIICTPINDKIPSPSCTNYTSVFMENYVIKNTFSRKYISEWREIDLGLKKLFMSFIVNGN